MIKLSVMYPNHLGNQFDMIYYSEKHIPLVHQLVGPALRQSTVDQGLCGMTANSPAPYLAVGHFYFDSLESFQESFGPNVPQLVADIPNFTNAQPTIQISEVRL
jgi:uncharacterized protein (TIGR02118 family)